MLDTCGAVWRMNFGAGVCCAKLFLGAAKGAIVSTETSGPVRAARVGDWSAGSVLDVSSGFSNKAGSAGAERADVDINALDAGTCCGMTNPDDPSLMISGASSETV